MEALVKAELLQQEPAAKFAFSRPGYLTFRLPSPQSPAAEFRPTGILHRTYGRGLGHVQVDATSTEHLSPTGRSEQKRRFGVKQLSEWAARPNAWLESPEFEPLLQQSVRRLESLTRSVDQAVPRWDGLHVWVRDGLAPAANMNRHSAVDQTPGWLAFCQHVAQTLKSTGWLVATAEVNHNAQPGQRILDLCWMEPHQWCWGEHLVEQAYHRWSGGVIPILPTAIPPISRAYYKVREAVCWAELPLKANDRCVEIGAAPGGSCQWLLEQGCQVIGIDPADMDPAVAEHPKFTHIRRRGREVRRRDIAGCRWLLSDANLPPNYILATCEDLLTHASVRPQGLILTLKLPQTQLLGQWERWCEKIHGWGFTRIRGRQLVFNRQEVCLVATQH